MKYTCRISNCNEIESKIIDFVKENPMCTSEDISNHFGLHPIAVNRVLSGRKGSKICAGLINTGELKAVPSVNEKIIYVGDT